MAATLPELCQHLILKELERDWKAQYACSLINHHWCVSAISELWKNPFSFCFEFGQKERYIQLMDTYIKCLSREFRESVGLDSTTKAAFDYTNFLRYFWPNDICATIKVWLDTKTDKISPKEKVFVIFKALCENFIINSTYIEGIHLNEQQMINIFELPQVEENLSNITYLSCLIRGDKVGYLPTLLLSASRISKNIKEVAITWINDDTPLDLTVKNMSQLIKNQRRLEDVTISCLDSDFPIIWTSILEHRNVLTSLQLNLIQFSESNPFPLDELAILSNLQRLEIHYCSNFKFSINEIDLSLSFQKLNKISIIMGEDEFSPGFVEILLRQSNEKIKELTLLSLDETKDILYNCKEYCTKLINLNCSIDMGYFDLFLSYLDDLKCLETLSLKDLTMPFSFQLSYQLRFDREDILFLLGQHLPKSTINFTYNLEHDFPINILFKFFKICKDRGIKFKVLNFSNCTFFNDEYIYLLLDYYGNGQLGELYLDSKKNFSKKCVEDVEKHVGFVEFSGDHVKKYQLPIGFDDYNELY